MTTDENRVEQFRKTNAAEQFIAHLNSSFCIGEKAATERLGEIPEYPTLFVVGAPRSGTTVLMQWLANWSAFGVPTNLLARFHQAPYLGGLIQRLLTDKSLAYLDELTIPGSESGGFHSVVGKTSGVLSPHEFFYFWRRFFPLDRGRAMTEAERKNADPVGFSRALRHLEAAIDKPLAMKAIIMQYDIEMIASAVPNSIFLYTRRNEVDNCDSILESRKRVHGSTNEWFSVMPPGAEQYLSDIPIMQVAAQVSITNDLIREQLRRLDKTRVIEIEHESFCNAPELTAKSIVESMSLHGCKIDLPPHSGSFVNHARQPSNRREIEQALLATRQQSDTRR